jgi:hypothetical protein
VLVNHKKRVTPVVDGQLTLAEGLKAMEQIAGLIAGKKIKKIVVIAGAGISTSAGIPDFRTPGSLLHR